MKRNSLIAAGALCSLLALGACGNASKSGADEGQEKDMSVEFTTYKYSQIAEVVGADSLEIPGWKYSAVTGEGVLPEKVGKSDITALRDSLERLADVTFTSGKSVEARVDTTMYRMTNLPDSTEACGSAFNQLSVIRMNPRIIVWKDYAGGSICMSAHGTYSTTYVNYDVAANKILSVADLMKPGYEEKLAGILRDQLKSQGTQLLVPLNEVNIPKNFTITDDGIMFMWALYEIAPYAAGEISVEVPGYQLQDILNSEAYSLIYGQPLE